MYDQIDSGYFHFTRRRCVEKSEEKNISLIRYQENYKTFHNIKINYGFMIV